VAALETRPYVNFHFEKCQFESLNFVCSFNHLMNTRNEMRKLILRIMKMYEIHCSLCQKIIAGTHVQKKLKKEKIPKYIISLSESILQNILSYDLYLDSV